jgi:hypothetical protein
MMVRVIHSIGNQGSHQQSVPKPDDLVPLSNVPEHNLKAIGRSPLGGKRNDAVASTRNLDDTIRINLPIAEIRHLILPCNQKYPCS